MEKDRDQMSLLRRLRFAIYRHQFILIALIVGVSGTWFIVAPQQSPFPSVARELGIAFLAAGTIGLALEFYTRRQFQELVKDELGAAVDHSALSRRIEEMLVRGSLGGDLRELGVRRIHRDRNAINFARLIEEADPGTEIRLLGICLAGFMDRRTQVILKKKLNEGCSIRLLIIDPESDFVRQRATEENRLYEDIKQDITAADDIHANFIRRRLPESLRNQTKLGHYDAAPAYFIFSTHKTMIVGFYLREDLGEFFPQLELDIKEGGIHSSFDTHFEALWRARTESGESGVSGEPSSGETNQLRPHQ